MSQQPPEYGLAPSLHEVSRTRKGPWILFLVVALVAIGGALYGGRAVSALRESVNGTAPSSYREPPPPPDPDMRVVVFEVTGLGKAFTITATAGASIKNETAVTLPWRHIVQVPVDAPKTVMLVAVAGPDGTEVHGRYTIDGTVVRMGSASGPYGVLTITDS